MTQSVSHSRWARPGPWLCLGGLASGAAVFGARWIIGPWASVLAALVAIPSTVWIVHRATLYPRVYQGKTLALAGFVLAFLGMSDAGGHLGFSALWRRMFFLSGGDVALENPELGWRVRYPSRWETSRIKSGAVTTFIFKPRKVAPGIEFSVTHRPETDAPDLASAVESFLTDLPKSGTTQILSKGPVRYPKFQKAYEVVYEDSQPIVSLRHRVIFVSGAEGLTVLSAASLPQWYDRLASDADRFLFSYEPL